MNLPTLQLLVLHICEEQLMRLRETAMCYNCTICRILGFRYELLKSGVNLMKIL